MSSSIRATLMSGLVAIVLVLQACATPSEIKSASLKQLELIDSLDHAVQELQASSDCFYRDHANLVRAEGRMQIARAAVMKATQPAGTLSADELFSTYEAEAHPWILLASTRQVLESNSVVLANYLAASDKEFALRNLDIDGIVRAVVGIHEVQEIFGSIETRSAEARKAENEKLQKSMARARDVLLKAFTAGREG